MTATEMKTNAYNLLTQENGTQIKMWTHGVPVDPKAITQLQNTAKMPFVFKHLAVMPDVHVGKGSTIGSVTQHAEPSYPQRLAWISVVE